MEKINIRLDKMPIPYYSYEKLTGRLELYALLQEGMDDVAAGDTRPFSEAMTALRGRRVK